MNTYLPCVKPVSVNLTDLALRVNREGLLSRKNKSKLSMDLSATAGKDFEIKKRNLSEEEEGKETNDDTETLSAGDLLITTTIYSVSIFSSDVEERTDAAALIRYVASYHTTLSVTTDIVIDNSSQLQDYFHDTSWPIFRENFLNNIRQAGFRSLPPLPLTLRE